MKALRVNAVLSQAEVAERVGVTAVTVSRWEIGMRKPRPEHIRALAKAFGVTPQVVLAAVNETPQRGPLSDSSTEEE